MIEKLSFFEKLTVPLVCLVSTPSLIEAQESSGSQPTFYNLRLILASLDQFSLKIHPFYVDTSFTLYPVSGKCPVCSENSCKRHQTSFQSTRTWSEMRLVRNQNLESHLLLPPRPVSKGTTISDGPASNIAFGIVFTNSPLDFTSDPPPPTDY